MRAFLLLAGLVCAISRAGAALHDVSYGTFEAPDDFVFEHTGTIDSFRGRITRKSDGFTINFEMGRLSGIYLLPGPGHHDHCYFFRTHQINGVSAATGLELKGKQKTVATTISDQVRAAAERQALLELPVEERAQKMKTLKPVPKEGRPANASFWAEFNNDADLAEFMLIVSSYRAKTDQPKSAD